MAHYELVMPKMGESVAEATIIKWLKNEGETIDLEEAVIEIATDKVDSEVPSPVSGILVKKLFQENDVVQVGQAVAVIDTGGDAAPAPSAPAASEPAPVQEVARTVAAAVAATEPVVSSEGRFYSPLVKNIAKEEGVSQAELDAIQGSGSEGRVTKSDILQFIENRKAGKVGAPAPAAPAPVASTPAAPQAAAAPAASTQGLITIKPPVVTANPGDEIIEMDRMRKMIAENMVMSKHVSPHVTSYVEADVTNIVRWRDKVKSGFEKREGEKITFTPIFIQAIVKAIKDFPMINISVDGTNIIKRKDINIGMAAALPSGNLIVPVIKNADRLNLMGITKSVNDLANRARTNKLKPEEIQGGTYTITNVGTFGNVLGTPIIPQPQVAIMAVGAIRKKPAVMETPDGDVIAIRHMMFLSHSYDHRVVDGALGGMFVRRVADYLEAWDMNTEI